MVWVNSRNCGHATLSAWCSGMATILGFVLRGHQQENKMSGARLKAFESGDRADFHANKSIDNLGQEDEAYLLFPSYSLLFI